MRTLTLIAGLILILLASAMSCNDPCNTRRLCTDILNAVTTQVQDSPDDTVTVDDVYTFDTVTGEEIRHPQGPGMYVVLDDTYLSNMRNQTRVFKFFGLSSGDTVIEESYIISADCCHIKKVDGKDTIVIGKTE